MLNVTFDDEAITTIGAAFNAGNGISVGPGSFRPFGSLTAFDAGSSNSVVWNLVITDTSTSGDSDDQLLSGWSLTLCRTATSAASGGMALDLNKSGPYTVSVASGLPTFAYTLTVQNLGATVAATGSITLTEFLPPQLDLQSIAAGTCSFGGPSTAPGPATLTYTNTSALASGASCNLVLNVQPKSFDAVCTAPALFNRAQGRFTGTSTQTDESVWYTYVEGCTTQLAIAKTLASNPPLYAGQVMSYNLQITNTGVITAYNVEVTDLISAPVPGATLLSLSGAPGCSNGGFCNIPALGPNRSITLTAKVQIGPDAPAGAVQNIACVEASNAPQACKEAAGTFGVAADLSVAKRVIQSVAAPGGQLLFEWK